MIFATPPAPPRGTVRQPVLLGLFTGTAIGAGYLLAGVPNVELMTLVTALAGAVLGPWSGAACGAVAAVVYSLGSPLGLPVPLLLAAQAAGLAAAGPVGAWGGNRLAARRFKGADRPGLIWSGLTGVGATFIYDLLTNLSIVGAFDARPVPVLVGALPFFLLHAGSNAVVFALLFPLLVPRLRPLRYGGLFGGPGGAAVLVLAAVLVAGGRAGAQADPPAPGDRKGPAPALADSTALAPAAGDSTAAGGRRRAVPADEAPPPTGPARAFGWQRALWTPFARTNLEWLGWRDHRVPVVDGGLGAQAVILGEAGSDLDPLFLRDGIPVGTGHALVDDPWLTPTEGLVRTDLAEGADGWGGTGGVVGLTTADPQPDKAVSGYRGVKGRHETYFRGIHLLTPRADWRVGFEFEESLDVEGYNFTTLDDLDFAASTGRAFPGHSRVRQGRARVVREFGPRDRLEVTYGTGRLTKDLLPVLGAEHLELWDDHVAVLADAALAGWDLRTRVFWRNRDAAWGSRDDTAVVGEDLRLLETGREGVALDLLRHRPDGGPANGATLRLISWRVQDSLADETWLDGFAGDRAGRGGTGRALGRLGGRAGAATWRLAGGADWDDRSDFAPTGEAGLDLGGDAPWLRASATLGGRAPRSDELLTPLRRDVAGRKLVLLPDPGLKREKTVRVGASLHARLLGFDLAVEGSLRRLTDGIMWEALPGESDRGAWRNGLEMDSSRLTGSVAREGRFLGWVRLMVEGTWQQSDERAGRAAWLPPEQSFRSHLMWENHFFQEDGILQIALLSTRQGEMADPWDVTRTAILPERTVHDLLIGFRLVGAHLGLGLRNLTGERTRLTSGALSTGQEMDLRLQWGWVY